MAIQAHRYSGFGLASPQDLMTDNACGSNDLSFIPQQQKPQQEQQLLMQSISTHIENQRMEIDLFINSQNERLRMALQEQRRCQMALFMKKYESKIQLLIKHKEEEIMKATNRTAELQDFLRRLEIENQRWQKEAQQNEAMVASLNGTIERLTETAGNAAEDAESCCVEEEGKAVKWEQRTRKMVCRSCNSRHSCVIMLPCRHLCSCRDCEALLDSCPVCKMAKKASVEALI